MCQLSGVDTLCNSI